MAQEVYFIQCDDKIKIGVCLAGTAQERLVDLQVGNPNTMTLVAVVPGDQELETALHHQFSRIRVRGEWFKADNELVSYIKNLRACVQAATNRRVIVESEAKPASPWLNGVAASKYAGVSKRLLAREVKRGRLRAARVGGRRELLYRREWLDQWLESLSAPVEVNLRRVR